MEHGNHIDLPPLLPLLVLLTGAPMKTPAENLRKAAALLRERGWCQGEYELGGALCVVGAVSQAVTGGVLSNLVSNKALDIARAALPEHAGRTLVAWNDAPGRTADEVIALLEKAATLAEVSK